MEYWNEDSTSIDTKRVYSGIFNLSKAVSMCIESLMKEDKLYTWGQKFLSINLLA